MARILGKRKRHGISIAADALSWASVTSDHLDDAEGFFGLEEVSDVEVVKDASNGQISFKVGQEDEWTGFESDNAQPLANISRKSKPKPPSTLSETRQDQDSNAFDTLRDINEREVDVSAWRSFQLSPEILSSLSKSGFSKPTAIQQAAIPKIIDGHDVVGKAATGSGKTIAFGIPIIEHILRTQTTVNSNGAIQINDANKNFSALIISPTRELAHQLSRHLTDLCSGITNPPSIVTITGGLSLLKQQRLLKGADIVIGTPGRLWEIVSQTPGMTIRLQGLRFLVLDEADRLLSEGHFQEVQELIDHLEKRVQNLQREDAPGNEDEIHNAKPWQTLVFSATFQKDLQHKLTKRIRFSKQSTVMDTKDSMEYLFQKLNFRDADPKFIDVDPVSQMASNLTESVLECGAMRKDLYLYTLLFDPQYQHSRILIFTNSISSVRRLTSFLNNLNLPALPLHSQMPQKSRLRSLERFSSSRESSNTIGSGTPSSDAKQERSILVATDVAARGLDIPTVSLIIHYHVPRAADTYVHRSGRTARAGASGSSILICSPEEVQPVQRLIARVHATTTTTTTKNKATQFHLDTITLGPTLLQQLKPRVSLSATLTESALAKEKHRSEKSFFAQAAEDLGVEYGSDEEEEAQAKIRGRGKGRMRRERRAREMSDGEVGAMKRELKRLMGERVGGR